MTQWSKPVFSKMVSEIGYDDETNEMTITWAKSGKTSAYAGVPEEIARQAANAASVGQYVISEIKQNYPHRYV